MRSMNTERKSGLGIKHLQFSKQGCNDLHLGSCLVTVLCSGSVFTRLMYPGS